MTAASTLSKKSGNRSPSPANASARSRPRRMRSRVTANDRSEEHTSELQSRLHLVCRLLLEKKNTSFNFTPPTTPSPLTSYRLPPRRITRTRRLAAVTPVHSFTTLGTALAITAPHTFLFPPP